MYKKTIWIGTIVVLSCSVLVSPALGGQHNTSHRIYKQVMEKLESLTPGEAIEVKMGIRKEEYNVGEPFELRFQTSEDCYVVLMYISAPEMSPINREFACSDIVFLIPSYGSPNTRIDGGRVYSTLHDFGLGFSVAPPYGYETINLFCSPEKIDLFEADFVQEEFYIISPDDEERLQDLLNRLDQLDRHEWSGTSVSFYIRGKRGVPRKFGALPPIGAAGSTGKWFPPIGANGTTGKR